jgi:hypothetical protein
MTLTAQREDQMTFHNRVPTGMLVLIFLMMSSFNIAEAASDGKTRAAWLLQHESLETMALAGFDFDQGEFETESDGGGALEMESADEYSSGSSTGLTMLASLVLPGSGEALMGYKRGYAMMVLDIFAWTQVAKYHSDGGEYRDEYYAFADAHYTDERLVEGYNSTSTDIERSGEGALYFPDIDNVSDVSELYKLNLYVSKEDDRREYYENLGKWDQFIFGWDDYRRASEPGLDAGGNNQWSPADYEPTNTISDLRQPWVSRNRQIYREMRAESNDAFKSRDQWMYVNIGLRVFSILQVAYLQGLLGGGGDNELAVAGHPVEIIAQPYGVTRGTVAARVSF